MKIIFIAYSLRGGGAERVISRLSNHLSDIHDVSVLLLSDLPSFYHLDDKVRLIKADYPKPERFSIKYYLQMAWHVRKHVKKIQPDGVFVFGESITSFCLLVMVGLPVRKFVSNRASPLANMNGFRGMINPWVYPLADGVIVQTKKAIDILKAKYKRSTFVSIPNPVEIPEKITPILDRNKVIINVGYLGGKKNQSELIEMFKDIEDRDNWELMFIGDGPDKDMLTELAEKLNISEKVHFLGARKDVSELLNNAQIFAFTSKSEGFPNALAEALAHGCACISYDILTGPGELIEHKYNGYLISGDQTEYSNYLQKLMKSDKERLSFMKNARECIDRFDMKKISMKYLNVVNNEY